MDHTATPIDMLYWEPVGSLISTILAQIILGARAYAVRNSPCLNLFRGSAVQPALCAEYLRWPFSHWYHRR